MKLRSVPARMGLTWMGHGLRACARQPMGFIGLLGMVACAAMVTLGLPVLGPFVVIAVMPVIWMAFMLASRRAIEGQRVTPSVLIEPLRAQEDITKVWMPLGGAYLLSVLLIKMLADLLGPGPEVLADAFESAKDLSEALNAPAVQTDLLWRLALTMPVSLLFWHTPALVFWARVPLLKSLFFSAMACWHNIGAFILYGLSWTAAIAALGLAGELFRMASPEPILSNILMAIGGLWLASAFYASLYFTVVDCFEPASPTPTTDAPPDAAGEA